MLTSILKKSWQKSAQGMFQAISPGVALKTSLLRRLQAQTLPNATPPLGKIPPFTNF